jgi:hypothetical protein
MLPVGLQVAALMPDSPVTVPLPDPVCEALLLTLAVPLAVASALRVRVTDAVML